MGMSRMGGRLNQNTPELRRDTLPPAAGARYSGEIVVEGEWNVQQAGAVCRPSRSSSVA